MLGNHFLRVAIPTALCATALASVAAVQAPQPPRIAVVGASMSAGFRLEQFGAMLGGLDAVATRAVGRPVGAEELAERSTSIEPARVLSAAWETEIPTHADVMLFMRPAARARKVLEAALETRPELLIGVDLLFWFGYGTVPGDGPGSPTDRESRLALQQQGFDLIDELLAEPLTDRDITLVLGDYPDISDAVRLMISDGMIPSAAVRQELDDRLAAWAAERPHVLVFPLARQLDALRAGEVRVTLDGVEHAVHYDRSMQLARVHPTRLGVAVLTREFCRWGREHLAPPLRPATDAWELFLDASDTRAALLAGPFEAAVEATEEATVEVTVETVGAGRR